jgi:hypothetical protein
MDANVQLPESRPGIADLDPAPEVLPGAPNLEELESELATLRQQVSARRAATTELRAALQQLSWSEVTLYRRMALGAGILSGAGAFVGFVSLLHLLKEWLLGAFS